MGEAAFFRKHRLDPNEAKRMYDLGYCDQQIADECGVSRDSVREWRRRNDLAGHSTPYQRKEEKRKSTLVEMAMEAKAHGMSYGEYMVARREGRV